MLLFTRIVPFQIAIYILIFPMLCMAEPDVDWKKLQSLDNIEYFKLEQFSENKKAQKYHLFVKLPSEYEDDKQTKFPTLYLLDGGINFPMFAAYYNFLRLMEDVPPMIIVGLSYGTNDWQKGNSRSHDFTAPSEERDHYGGANKFDKFLTEVVLPEIQSRYRVDDSKQILFGQSLGGQFALFSSMYGKTPFYAVIASNPALHRNLEFFKQKVNSRQNRPKIFISSAEFDDVRYKQPLTEWHKYWQKTKPNWNYEFVALERHNHLSATPESIRLGLKSVLNNQ